MILPETVRYYDCIITARTVEPVAFPTASDPLSVDPLAERYSGFAINSSEPASFTAELPKRRISVGARVVPAEIGDPCRLVFINGVPFLHVHEGIPFREACPP